VPALADLLTERLGALVAAEVALTPAAVRSVVETLGGGSGRHALATGNRLLAAQVGVNVRTVQRWQKEPGSGEARAVTRTRTEGVTAAVQGIANAQARDLIGRGQGGQGDALANVEEFDAEGALIGPVVDAAAGVEVLAEDIGVQRAAAWGRCSRS